MSMNVSTERQNIRRVRTLCDQLLQEYPEMTIQTLKTFMVIAEKEGKTLREIGELCGIADSSATRNVQVLEKGAPRIAFKGLDWVVTRQHPLDGRKKVVHLTAKGQRAIETFHDIIEYGRS